MPDDQCLFAFHVSRDSSLLIEYRRTEMAEMEKYTDKLIKVLRVRLKDAPGYFGRLADAIGAEGANLGDITRVRVTSHYVVRDVVVYIENDGQLERIVRAIGELQGIKLVEIIDEVLRIHEGGKVAMHSTVELRSVSDLAKIYTPGVAQVCRRIAADRTSAASYTGIANTVAIVTNGTAILGLGDIGPVAGMPVMEGKAVIMEQMADISPVPILLDSKDPDEIVRVVSRIAPTFGVIQLEDIAAPICFEVERRLDEMLDIPVFHDDQHGTAVVALGALITALKRVGKVPEAVKVVISGAGAAGMAIARMLLHFGVSELILCDREGAIYPGRSEGMNRFKEEIADRTNPERKRGTLAEMMAGADVFIGVSAPNLVTADMVRRMAEDAIVFAMANPVPEIRPDEALNAGAAIASDGRSLNNALAFPGILRGALDARVACITDAMKMAASASIAEQTRRDEIVPDFMHREFHRKLAEAVREAAVA